MLDQPAVQPVISKDQVQFTIQAKNSKNELILQETTGMLVYFPGFEAYTFAVHFDFVGNDDEEGDDDMYYKVTELSTGMSIPHSYEQTDIQAVFYAYKRLLKLGYNKFAEIITLCDKVPGYATI